MSPGVSVTAIYRSYATLRCIFCTPLFLSPGHGFLSPGPHRLVSSSTNYSNQLALFPLISILVHGAGNLSERYPDKVEPRPMVRRMRKFKALNLFLRNADTDMHWANIHSKTDLPFLRIGLSKVSPFFTKVKFDKMRLILSDEHSC